MAERTTKLDQLRTFREARFLAAERAERAAAKPETDKVLDTTSPALKKPEADA